MKLFTRIPLVTLTFLSFSSQFVIASQTPTEDQAEMNAIDVSNGDVRWDGTPFGLTPILNERTAKYLKLLRGAQQNGEYDSVRKKLRALLNDPDRFVVAHVLLTFLADKEFEVSSERWNHLRVVLRRDSTIIAKEQMSQIAALWDTPCSPKQ